MAQPGADRPAVTWTRVLRAKLQRNYYQHPGPLPFTSIRFPTTRSRGLVCVPCVYDLRYETVATRTRALRMYDPFLPMSQAKNRLTRAAAVFY